MSSLRKATGRVPRIEAEFETSPKNLLGEV